MSKNASSKLETYERSSECMRLYLVASASDVILGGGRVGRQPSVLRPLRAYSNLSAVAPAPVLERRGARRPHAAVLRLAGMLALLAISLLGPVSRMILLTPSNTAAITRPVLLGRYETITALATNRELIALAEKDGEQTRLSVGRIDEPTTRL